MCDYFKGTMTIKTHLLNKLTTHFTYPPPSLLKLSYNHILVYVAITGPDEVLGSRHRSSRSWPKVLICLR